MANSMASAAQRPFASILVPDTWRPEERPMFCTITAADPNKGISLEELRLQDYLEGRRPLLEDVETFPIRQEGLTSVASRVELEGRKYGASIVTFKVGSAEGAANFVIHEHVVVTASEFVRLALQRDWQEARTREISLTDVEPAVFEVYQTWLYERRISLSCCVSLKASRVPHLLVFILKVWTLGDRFLDTAFKDQVMDTLATQIVQRSFVIAHVPLAAFVYNHTPDGSAPRRLITDLYVHQGTPSWLDDVSNSIEAPRYADFWRDISKAYSILHHESKSGVPTRPAYWQPTSTCRYHHHEEGKCFRFSNTAQDPQGLSTLSSLFPERGKSILAIPKTSSAGHKRVHESNSDSGLDSDSDIS